MLLTTQGPSLLLAVLTYLRPQRGSFPLDHDGKYPPLPLRLSTLVCLANNTSKGECKDVMTGYLACMKKVRGVNDNECRNMAKAYLSCRMDR